MQQVDQQVCSKLCKQGARLAKTAEDPQAALEQLRALASRDPVPEKDGGEAVVEVDMIEEPAPAEPEALLPDTSSYKLPAYSHRKAWMLAAAGVVCALVVGSTYRSVSSKKARIAA